MNAFVMLLGYSSWSLDNNVRNIFSFHGNIMTKLIS